jgi:UDP-glucose 4-epimerase
MVLNKIGLTGATGMLGRHIRSALENEGAYVISTSSKNLKKDKILKWDLTDWLSYEELDLLFHGVQAVIHVGAIVPHTTNIINECAIYDANVRACMNLGYWASERNVPVVYVSGAIVYKNQNDELHDENSERGWNDLGGYYGFSKLLGESVLTSLCSKELKLSVVRPSSIYGSGLREDKMITSFLTMAINDEVIELSPPVEDRIDFIHALDVSNAILQILKTESWDSFNISSGTLLSVKELAEACVEVAGCGSILINEIKSLPRKPIKRFSLNSRKARDSLDWEPVLNIKQGLNMMIHKTVSEIN